MADGATFQIDIEANSLGVDASADRLQALASKLVAVDTVATKFDTAVAAAAARLEETTAAAKLASDALGVAEKKYAGLELVADRAAKALEKAAAQGKPTEALKAAADAAASAMREQAKVVDDLATRSKAAASAQTSLAGAMKTLQDKQKAAAAETKKANDAAAAAAAPGVKFIEAKEAAEQAAPAAKKLGDNFSAAKLAAFGMAAGTLAAVAGLARFAVASNPAAMMRLSLISERLHYSFLQIFRGLNLGAFLTSIQKFAALFEQSNASGRALKLLVETIFQPMFDAVAKLEPYVAEAFKGMVYGALKLVVAVLSIRNAIFKAMSPELRAEVKAFVDKVFTLENAFKIGEVAAGLLAVGLAFVAVSLLEVVAGAALAVAPFVLIGAALYELIDNWEDISQWISDWWDSFVDHPADAVAAMLDGIVQGIEDGAKWVYDAMSSLADGAVDAFKETLGIKSPSKVFALQGRYTTAGYVEGIEEGTPSVSRALEGMVPPSDVGGAASTSVSTSSSSSTTTARTVHIENLTIGTGPVAQQTWQDFKRAVTEVLEGVSITIGGGEVPTS